MSYQLPATSYQQDPPSLTPRPKGGGTRRSVSDEAGGLPTTDYPLPITSCGAGGTA